jgi:hypothetical protein
VVEKGIVLTDFQLFKLIVKKLLSLTHNHTSPPPGPVSRNPLSHECNRGCGRQNFHFRRTGQSCTGNSL